MGPRAITACRRGAMRNQLFSVAAILFSAAIFIAGNGLIGTLIPVRASLAGFSNQTLGLIGSTYYRRLRRGLLRGPAPVRARRPQPHLRGLRRHRGRDHPAAVDLRDATVWILMRGGFGFAAASLYMVIESWLNERATHESRGRIFSTYMTVNFASLIVGQMLFSSNKPTSFTLFDLTAVLYALCLIPVGPDAAAAAACDALCPSCGRCGSSAPRRSA